MKNAATWLLGGVTALTVGLLALSKSKGEQARVGDRVDVKTADLQGQPDFVKAASEELGVTPSALTVRVDSVTKDAVQGPIVGIVGPIKASGLTGEARLDFTKVEGTKFPQGIGPVSIPRGKIFALNAGV